VKISLSGVPALHYLIYFCMGIISAKIFSISLLLSIIILLCVLALILMLKEERIRAILFAICIIISGSVRISLAESNFIAKHALEDQKSSLILSILKQKSNPYYIESYVAEANVPSGKIRGTLYAKKTTPILIPGHAYKVSAISIVPIKASKNPYVFNYLDYAKVHGLSHSFQIEKHAELKDLGITKPMIFFAHQVRTDISIRYLSVLGIEKGSLVNGLLLGLKSEIPPCLADLFRQLGVSHLLAVSGLHVGLIMLIIYQLLLTMSLPRLARTLIIALFLFFYCFLSGGSPSVIRSSLMSVMLLFAPLFRRKYNALNAVAASAVILLIANPFMIQDLGFQFSYSAVFGIMIGYTRLKELIPIKPKNSILKYITDMLGVSLSAALFTAPVAMFYFNSLQLASMFLNLLVIPLTFCVMICAILSLPGLFFPSILSDIIIHALDLSLDVFRAVLRLASRSNVWTVHVSSYWKPIIFCTILVILVLFIVDKKKWKIAGSAILSITCIIWFYLSTRPECIQLALDKGHAILCRKGRSALIINTGAVRFNSNDHERSIQPILDHWGTQDVMIMISEWEKYKIGNINSILRIYPDAKIFIPDTSLDLEYEYCRIERDTLLEFASSDLNVNAYEAELAISLSIGKRKIYFYNETKDSLDVFIINRKLEKARHNKFY
jgi:competence protein ComEC